MSFITTTFRGLWPSSADQQRTDYAAAQRWYGTRGNNDLMAALQFRPSSLGCPSNTSARSILPALLVVPVLLGRPVACSDVVADSMNVRLSLTESVTPSHRQSCGSGWIGQGYRGVLILGESRQDNEATGDMLQRHEWWVETVDDETQRLLRLTMSIQHVQSLLSDNRDLRNGTQQSHPDNAKLRLKRKTQQVETPEQVTAFGEEVETLSRLEQHLINLKTMLKYYRYFREDTRPACRYHGEAPLTRLTLS
ncbi:hypothetical protein FGADI_13245 [Fusarium gaditjirri]|uniref:Uncharacterized protein n=1 Tax=Fusarium gaditjirri TaxID=282569 RepID=A0A8H4SQM1_9HYPO|nr:hypothetical protein FGADI_13245 [Fusarium gaditjirri]